MEELIQLKVLNYLEKLKKHNPSDEEYISSFIDIIENFEESLNEKKPRNKKKLFIDICYLKLVKLIIELNQYF